MTGFIRIIFTFFFCGIFSIFFSAFLILNNLLIVCLLQLMLHDKIRMKGKKIEKCLRNDKFLYKET